MNPPNASLRRFRTFARIHRYPPTLRVVGLFGSMLASAIVLGATLAEIEAADRLDFVLHVIAGLAGAAIAWLGLELGLRRIALTPEGIATWLARLRLLRWEEVRHVRSGPLGTLLIISKRRSLIVIWPYLEGFDALLAGIESARRERMGHA